MRICSEGDTFNAVRGSSSEGDTHSAVVSICSGLENVEQFGEFVVKETQVLL
jgi:hypothetical protein